MDIVLSYIKDDTLITRLWLGPFMVVTTKAPEVTHAVFNSPHCYDKPSIFYGSLIFTKGLLLLSGKVHEKHRKIFNKAFTPRRLQELYGVVNHCTQIFIKKLAPKIDQEEFDVYYHIGACSLESFGLANLNYHEDLYGHKIIPYVDA
jgi:cytochrome P450